MQISKIAIVLGLATAVGAGAGLVILGVVPLPGSNTTPQFPDIQDAVLDPSNATPAEVQSAAYSAFEEGKFLTALSLAQDAAARGDPQAFTLIGRIYSEGTGVSRNDAKAAEAYGRGAELGDVNAMVSYAVMLAAGSPEVKQDRTRAAEYFERAAMTGDALANYNLGLLFLRGQGKPENPYRAAQHIRYAAEKNLPSAQYDLAAMYQSGTGVPNDGLEAANWMSKAAASGLTAAEYDYAVMLLRGQGLARDMPKAIKYLTTAAEKGVAGAQNRLAHVYFEGIGGVDKSFAEAAKWRMIAKANGIEKDDKLELLMAALTPDQIAAAEKAAVEWRESREVR